MRKRASVSTVSGCEASSCDSAAAGTGAAAAGTGAAAAGDANCGRDLRCAGGRGREGDGDGSAAGAAGDTGDVTLRGGEGWGQGGSGGGGEGGVAGLGLHTVMRGSANGRQPRHAACCLGKNLGRRKYPRVN